MSSTKAVFACLCLLFLSNAPAASATKFTSMFCFGDSFLDNGNLFALTGNPSFPFGETYPGFATGRYSDGVNLADTMAYYIGLSAPPSALFGLNASLPLPRAGINFAIGGAGAAGNILGDWQGVDKQVDYFAQVVARKKYNISTSLIYTSIGSNDYEVLRKDKFLTKDLMKKTVPIVINATWVQMKRIFDLGGRNFAILNLQPVQCQPQYVEGARTGKCLTTTLTNYDLHNEALKTVRTQLQKMGAKVVILDLYKVGLKVLGNPGCFRMAKKTIFSACCSGPPGNLNWCTYKNETTGAPLYTVCPDPSKSFWWDTDHFTQAAVKAMSALFFYRSGYTYGGPSFCNTFGMRCRTSSADATHPAAIPLSKYCVKSR